MPTVSSISMGGRYLPRRPVWHSLLAPGRSTICSSLQDSAVAASEGSLARVAWPWVSAAVLSLSVAARLLDSELMVAVDGLARRCVSLSGRGPSQSRYQCRFKLASHVSLAGTRRNREMVRWRPT